MDGKPTRATIEPLIHVEMDLRPLGGVPTICGLRRLLKRLLRTYSIKCEGIVIREDESEGGDHA